MQICCPVTRHNLPQYMPAEIPTLISVFYFGTITFTVSFSQVPNTWQLACNTVCKLQTFSLLL